MILIQIVSIHFHDSTKSRQAHKRHIDQYVHSFTTLFFLYLIYICVTNMGEHNLLKLIDILRTINDQNVSIESIKQLLLKSLTNQQFQHIVAWCHTTAYHASTPSINNNNNSHYDSGGKQWIINVTLNNIGTIRVTKPMIQLAIKNYYKQCQNFCFVENIHKALTDGDSNMLTITKIPQTNWTQLIDNHRTAQNISAEDVMILIFKCLNIKELSCCRGVCQQWLYDASNPQTVTHIDTFYMRQLIDHFVWYKPTSPAHNSIQNEQMWNKIGPLIQKHPDLYIEHQNTQYMENILKYNLDILKNCSSITVDTAHFHIETEQQYLIGWLIKEWQLDKVRTLQMTLSNPYSEQEEWLSFDFIGNRDYPLESVKVIILDDDDDMFQVQHLLSQQLSTPISDLQTSENESGTCSEICTNILNATRLEICCQEKNYSGEHLLECCNDVDLSKLECLKFSIIPDGAIKNKESIQRTVLSRFQYPHQQMRKIEYHHKIVDTLTVDSKDLTVVKLKGYSFSELYDKIKLWCEHSQLKLKKQPNIIKLFMTVNAERGTSWVNALLDLSKSKNLIKLIQYFNEQSKFEQFLKAELQLQVSHYGICDLDKEKWIQLIIKAITTVYNYNKKHNQNKNVLYPFDSSQQFPKTAILSQNISVKLLKPTIATNTTTQAEVTTTLYVNFNFPQKKSQKCGQMCI